jgi:hypothetical protein
VPPTTAREPENNLAVELLAGCGMIRRSEKRSLIGLKAIGRRTAVLNPDSPAAAKALPQLSGFSLMYPVLIALGRNEKSMLPLVNPF